MRMTKEDLLDAARKAAKYLPAASADLMNELANRLDVTSVALSESMEQRKALIVESAVKHEFISVCFRASASGAALDGADIQEIGERLGLFGRETYQPALHGYICGHEAGEDSVYVMKNAPATSSAIAALRAEVLAESIPDGYVLVPQEMHLPAESMEGICFHCGDGGHQFGEFTDGTLFIGEVDYGDGKKVYGLHIATAEYPEEGCATICEFARQLREGK